MKMKQKNVEIYAIGRWVAPERLMPLVDQVLVGIMHRGADFGRKTGKIFHRQCPFSRPVCTLVK